MGVMAYSLLIMDNAGFISSTAVQGKIVVGVLGSRKSEPNAEQDPFRRHPGLRVQE